MIAAAIVLVLLLLICFLRTGATAEYTDAGFALDVYLGPIRFSLLPYRKKKERGKTKKPKEKKVQEKKMIAGRLSILRKELPSINKTIEKLRRKLVIKELTIHYIAAGADPAEVAIYFGAASIGYGIILPLIENNFKIKERDLRASVDFQAMEPFIYVRAKLSLAVWELIYVAFGFVKYLMTSENLKSKTGKAV